ncbi:TonB family protein [Duganella sp. FT135W]|uniref:TonB family protein n=1 Tax=Duganella flavida TaxID=2692175 RepID=A0A6L8KB69_9BURK|nr:TonB family protein [Duganella flavida]MYM24300.1 TonB family protein [Duganella flavida]
MSSATLSLNDTFAPEDLATTGTSAPLSVAPAPVGSAQSAATHGAGYATSYLDAGAGKHWLRRPGALVTVAIHGVALLAILNWTGAIKRPHAPQVIELIHIMPQQKLTLAPPKPEPTKERQVALAPPQPTAQPQPAPKAVEAPPPTQAETIAPPTPPGPVVQAPPAPPAAPVASGPKQISTEGIPTDYVNQVYARINRNADYPREAKMRRQQGKVGYRLTLNPDGSLVTFDIQSSGVDSLDEAARDAIRRAAPFPRLPDLGGSSYLLAGNIVFKIN